MNSDAILVRLRQFLLGISAGIFIMTITELIFVSHWNRNIQYLPFALCGLGLAMLGIAFFRPSHATISTLRWSLLVIGVCSLIGFHQHMWTNYSFWREIQPEASTWELIVATVNGGVPVLAPGILLLGAIIGLTAVYCHPLLDGK